MLYTNKNKTLINSKFIQDIGLFLVVATSNMAAVWMENDTRSAREFMSYKPTT